MLHLLRQSHRGHPTVVEIGTRGAGHETLPAERTDRRRAFQGHRGSVEIADHGPAVVRGQGERFLGAIRCGHTLHNFHLRVRHLGRVQRPKEEVVPVGEEEPDDGTGEGKGQVAAGGVPVTDGKSCIAPVSRDLMPRDLECQILSSSLRARPSSRQRTVSNMPRAVRSDSGERCTWRMRHRLGRFLREEEEPKIETRRQFRHPNNR